MGEYDEQPEQTAHLLKSGRHRVLWVSWADIAVLRATISHITDHMKKIAPESAGKGKEVL